MPSDYNQKISIEIDLSDKKTKCVRQDQEQEQEQEQQNNTNHPVIHEAKGAQFGPASLALQ